MAKWIKCTLADIGEIVGGATPSTKRKDYFEGDIPWITPKDLSTHTKRYIRRGEHNISKEGLASCSAKIMPAKSILFTSRAPIGYVAISDNEICTNQGFKSIVPNEKIDYLFLFYLMKYYRVSIETMGSGTTFKEVSGKVMKSINIQIPEDKNTQRKIAAILDGIDSKIELNQEINDNLQDQTQAIYADMFIAKANSKWQRGHLSDLITVRYGKDHKKLANGSYPVFGSGGLMRCVERPLYDKESVLIPRKGTLNNVIYVNEPFWSVDTMFYTEMRLPNVAKFVYHFVKSQDLASMNAGSAVPSMTTDILNAMEVVIPSRNALSQFENTVSPMYMTMQENKKQNLKLAELRDVLLPKLMSGEIDISNIQF